LGARGVLLHEGSSSQNTKPNQIMKTKLTFLLTVLALAGIAPMAMAGPNLDEFALRRQIADSQRASRVVDKGSTRYVPNPSGKGRTVVESPEATTNIALFKSKKAGCCDKR
jgi:hypothetical protein